MRLGVMASKKFQESFEKLLKQKSVPVKTSFKLRSISKIVADSVAHYEEMIGQYAQEFGERDEAGNLVTKVVDGQGMVILNRERLPEYNAKLSELLTVEVEVPTISVSDN